MDKSQEYDLKKVKLPRLAGSMLRLSTKLLEGRFTREAVIRKLMQDTGLAELKKISIDTAPTFLPLHPVKPLANVSIDVLDTLLRQTPEAPKGFSFATISDYAEAYRSGKTTPEEVAQKILVAMENADQQNPPLKAFIACHKEDLLQQAKDSTARFQANQPLGIMDGVPVAVKDEVDQVPYGTTVGTCFLGKEPAKEDSTVVAKMRAAGALLIGKANMHEIGIGVTGLNPHHGPARNPYHPHHYTGGSSSGSAAATAAGFCPVAISADGGGSIRIPAGFCGMVGLKPTFGRISEFGAAPLTWSMAHLGPIASTAYDAAIAYAILSGPDEKDSYSLIQPPLQLSGIVNPDLQGLKIGIYRPWFEDATPEMVSACHKMLDHFVAKGAELVEVVFPHLESVRLAHIVTIASEMNTAMQPYYEKHQKEFGLDVRSNLALAGAFKATEYLIGQKIRTRAIHDFHQILKNVDVLVTPTTGCPAPLIPLDALPDGESNLTVLIEIMRFATLANLTGFPAISFPAGYTKDGLPIGFQVMGRPWEEALLLRFALISEQFVEKQKPRVHYSFLE